jgi:glutamate/tyrosine decarboxylase-like PLP-dependent enzyme
MLKPPHPVAMMAYMMAMQINPNNHALDGGPATAELERETIASIAQMIGFDAPLGHLSASGTIANLEALWVARNLNPEGAIAFSRQAHYTHGRMGEVLGMATMPIDVDDRGRMDLAALESALATGQVGTVVATLGTTGVGALDPLQDIIPLARRYGARVHVDAAYGGFYRLLAGSGIEAAPFEAIAEADSFVVDPHKHGLQPYGCGAVLFRDASVGRFYQHDSPYTYFTSKDLHLGEISLECSRAGAAAAAFWATLQAFPLRGDSGLGAVLASTRRAALAWAGKQSGAHDAGSADA